MKKNRVFNLICLFFLSFGSSFSLLLGFSLVNPDFEEVCYLNASTFAKENSPFQTLSFQYLPKNRLAENTYGEINDLVNSIDGGSKYYNYACLWGETDEFCFENTGLRRKLADLSFNEENPLYSTNFVELEYPSNYAKAFSFSFEFDEVDIGVNDFFQIRCFLDSEEIDNRSITFSSFDSEVASIDADGRVLSKSVGNGYIKATYLDYSASFKINVAPNKEKSIRTYKYAKAILPYDIAYGFGGEDYLSVVGTHVNAYVGTKKFVLNVCGVYKDFASNSKNRNQFYAKNYCNYVYFLRDSVCYIPIDRYCLTVGITDKVNMNLYNDMQVFKMKTNSTFSVPKEKEINNVVVKVNGRFLKVFELENAFDKKDFALLSVTLITGGLSLAGLCLFLLAKKRLYKRTDALIAIYVGGVIFSSLILNLTQTIKAAGITLSTITSAFGWVFISLSLIFALYLSYNVISASRKTAIGGAEKSNFMEINI